MGEAGEEREVRSGIWRVTLSFGGVLLSLAVSFVKQKTEGDRHPHNEYSHPVLIIFFLML